MTHFILISSFEAIKNVETCGWGANMSLSTQIYVILIQKCYFQVIMVLVELKQSKTVKNYIYDLFAVILGFEAMKHVQICGSCTITSLSTRIYVISIRKCHFQIVMGLFKHNQSKNDKTCTYKKLSFEAMEHVETCSWGTRSWLSTQVYVKSIQKCHFPVIIVISELIQSNNIEIYTYDSFAVISCFEAMKKFKLAVAVHICRYRLK